MSTVQFEMTPLAPFRLDLTGWALKRVPVDIVHQWHDDSFQRAFVVQGKPVLVSIRQSGVSTPRLHVNVQGQRVAASIQNDLEPILSRLLGVDMDLSDFYRIALKRNARLASLAKAYKGLKPQRFPSVFEAFVNGVSCQQLSLHVGILTLGRLTERFGALVPGTTAHAFVSPEVLADAKIEDLVELAYSRNKATYIIQMAQQLSSGELDLESFHSLPDDELFKRLLKIKGIGRWTAEYMMLRGYGRLNSFPIDDSGARAHLIEYMELNKDTDREELQSYVDMWKPYSGLLYFHLLMYRLARKGLVT